LLVNILSMSVTMVNERPCSLMMLSVKSWATVWVVKGWAKGRKWEYLVSLSTTTRMILYFPDLDRLSTKSMEMCVHAWLGRGSGTRSPG
jgi:hypothetical protein